MPLSVFLPAVDTNCDKRMRLQGQKWQCETQFQVAVPIPDLTNDNAYSFYINQRNRKWLNEALLEVDRNERVSILTSKLNEEIERFGKLSAIPSGHLKSSGIKIIKTLRNIVFEHADLEITPLNSLKITFRISSGKYISVNKPFKKNPELNDDDFIVSVKVDKKRIFSGVISIEKILSTSSRLAL